MTSYTIFDNINLEKKPIVKIGTFNIKCPPKTIAEGLVKMGTKCLDFIEQSVAFNTFRIEITPVNDQKLEWVYNLQVQTTTWFEHLCQNFSKNEVMEIARSYVNSVRNSYSPPPPPRKSEKISVPSNKYCEHHADCNFEHPISEIDQDWRNPRPKKNTYLICFHEQNPNSDKCYISVHCPSNVDQPIIFCAKSLPQMNRTNHFCNWYAENERIVLENNGWIVLSQQDDVREVLICPHPAIGYENDTIPPNYQQINHKNNRELIKDFTFWNWVLEYFLNTYLTKEICEDSEQCPIEFLALNFGIWEATEAKDKQAKEFHGHLHVHLTRSAIDRFEINEVDAMYGKIGIPKQYSIQDCEELESKYLLSLEINRLQQDMRDVRDYLGELNEKMDHILGLKPPFITTMSMEQFLQKLDDFYYDRNNNFMSYLNSFQEHGISIIDIDYLKEKDWIELGVVKIGDRIKMTRESKIVCTSS
ncbi:hypothetical protein RhiirA5_376053 [Rhizophagus irregularis]|uniref:Uncharacterized protein n=1 Tax=Rhizophagus irregularis TaxID=588596 RepID=A0A2I1EP69_9GLOM|nr:hypothetical protein RhiirA5_376053 [Rhizophagus irregularis]PKY23923.1 hypothetical protein RhiirB3_387607 [Rhizophagus irregularis]